jgi:iron complex transport system substrate-binding protein
MKTNIFATQSNYLFNVIKLSLTFSVFTLAALWSISSSADNQKIVAIDGSLTEIIYALGEGDKMVGRDITTVYPPEALKLPSVGYMRTLSAEGILSLKPQLVIATKDAKPRSVLDKLKNAGIRVELIDNQFTLEGVKEKIRQVAKVLNKDQKAEELIKNMQSTVDKATKIAKAKQDKYGTVKALYVMNMRGGNMMVAGKGSRADTMFNLALIQNPAADHFNGYKPLTAEAAIKYNPHYIVTAMHGLKSKKAVNKIIDTPALRMTEAGSKKQMAVMENGFLTFGPRIGNEIESLVSKVYGQ